MRYLVFLDDGHGLETEGKRTPLFSDGSFMHENEFNQEVVKRIDRLLEEYPDIDVIFTAEEKRDVSLDERTDRINDAYLKYKNLYGKIVSVSVHANAVGETWNAAGGTATFYYPGNMTDKAFAEIIQKNLIAKTGLSAHRGGVAAQNFHMDRVPKCPAVLCECAFMTNMEEAKLLLTDDFRQRCAEGIVNGLLEYFGIGNKKLEVRYKRYNDRIHELRGEIKDLGVKIVNQNNRTIVPPYCVNGTFFWPTDQQDIKYSTSILYADGKVYQAAANHLPCPQSVFIVYKNGTVAMKRIKNISELDLDSVRLAIGGIGLRNILDSTFRYSPVAEGFTGAYADVLRQTNKTVIGYNKTNGKVYLLAVKNATHAELLSIIADNSYNEAYDIALSVDGGGSTFLNNADSMIVKGDGRVIHNIIGFGL